jgi:hypothetical protein
MRTMIQTTYNRALVLVSSGIMFICAILAGAARQFFEHVQTEFKTSVIPSPPWEYATLGVIALLFLTGMVANAVLVMYPLQRRRAAISFILMAAVLVTLLLIATVYGSHLLRMLSWFGGHTVGGGGGDEG